MFFVGGGGGSPRSPFGWLENGESFEELVGPKVCGPTHGFFFAIGGGGLAQGLGVRLLGGGGGPISSTSNPVVGVWGVIE